MGDLTPLNSLPPLNPSPATRSMPFREDCWSEEATATLVHVWGRRYLELNRGNLRQNDWIEVAEAVNLRHGHTKKTRRTDVQCKNRIDTIKKKYKTEKARVCESNGGYVSPWPFFERLDVLIGDKTSGTLSRKTNTPPSSGGGGFNGFGMGRGEAYPRMRGSSSGTPPLAIALPREGEKERLPLAVAVNPKKRSAAVVDDSYFRRNYSAMAAAAAKEEVDDDEEFTEDEEMNESGDERADEKVEHREAKQGLADGVMMLAKAIESFGQIYEKVEMEKLKLTKELELERIKVGRVAELQRTEMLANVQVQLERHERDKKKSSGKKSSGVDAEKSDVFS